MLPGTGAVPAEETTVSFALISGVIPKVVNSELKSVIVWISSERLLGRLENLCLAQDYQCGPNVLMRRLKHLCITFDSKKQETETSASKHAIVGLSTSLRVEAAIQGVCVSVLCPGPVETDIVGGGKFGNL